MKEDVLVTIIYLFVLGALLGGAAIWDRAVCVTKTAEIGFASKWNILGGCRIEVQSGQWIPLDSYYFKQE